MHTYRGSKSQFIRRMWCMRRGRYSADDATATGMGVFLLCGISRGRGGHHRAASRARQAATEFLLQRWVLHLSGREGGTDGQVDDGRGYKRRRCASRERQFCDINRSGRGRAVATTTYCSGCHRLVISCRDGVYGKRTVLAAGRSATLCNKGTAHQL